MTPRQFVKDVMEYIREQTQTLDREEYDDWLDQLAFELEEERQRLNWDMETEE